MKNIVTVGRIISTRYKCTSFYGNPSYFVLFEDETGNTHRAQTATDAACAYGINNPEFKERSKITYHITATGTEIITYCVKPE